MKYIIIVIADWIDNNILRHRFYWICKKIGFSTWWPNNSITFPLGVIKVKTSFILKGNTVVKGM